jgi:cytochrome c-type biogenesis protein
MSAQPVTIALLAGVVSSIGPCAAPRYLAMLALVEPASGSVRHASVVRFALGTLCGYLALGVGGASLLWVLHDQRVIEWALAISFVIGGLALAADRHCDHRVGALNGFVPGFGSSLIASPCCTPAVLATAAAMESGVWAISALVSLAAFAIGHIAPVIIAGTTLRASTRLAAADRLRGVVPTIAGGCAVALGIYYGLAA